MLFSDLNERRTLSIQFLRSLQGHARPQVCVVTLFGWLLIFMHSLPENWTKDSDPDVRTQIIEGYDLMYSWATMPRSPEDVRAIEGLSCQCNFNESMETMVYNPHGMAHAMGTHLIRTQNNEQLYSRSDPPIVMVLTTAFSNFNRLWSTTDEKLPRLKRIRGRSQWPTSIHDLLPHGAEATMKGFLCWLSMDFKYHQFNRIMCLAMFGLIRMAQPYVITHITTSRLFLNRGVIASIGHLRRSLLLASGNPTQTDFAMANLSFFTREIHHLLMQCMDSVQRHRFVCTAPSELCQAFEQVIDTYHILSRDSVVNEAFPKLKIVIKQNIAIYEQLGSMIYSEYEGSLSAPIKSPIMASFGNLAAEREMDWREPWRQFPYIMYKLVTRDRCCAPGCSTTSLDRKLHYCAGCRRVAYCSRSCQRRSWGLEGCAHRDVCQAIRSLCMYHKIWRHRPSILASIKDMSKNLSRHSHPHPWYTLVSDHFNALSSLELRTPREHHIFHFSNTM
jgi:hypothetical protein